MRGGSRGREAACPRRCCSTSSIQAWSWGRSSGLASALTRERYVAVASLQRGEQLAPVGDGDAPRSQSRPWVGRRMAHVGLGQGAGRQQQQAERPELQHAPEHLLHLWQGCAGPKRAAPFRGPLGRVAGRGMGPVCNSDRLFRNLAARRARLQAMARDFRCAVPTWGLVMAFSLWRRHLPLSRLLILPERNMRPIKALGRTGPEPAGAGTAAAAP